MGAKRTEKALEDIIIALIPVHTGAMGMKGQFLGFLFQVNTLE
jgi:hypothetical protein